MRLSEENTALSNELRQIIQEKTDTVSDGEGVAMVLLWSFFMDHARIMGLEVNELARHQLEHFLQHAGSEIEMVQERPPHAH